MAPRWHWLAVALFLVGCSQASLSPSEMSQDPVHRREGPIPVAISGAHLAAGGGGVRLYDGTGQATLVAAEGRNVEGLHWSPDGRWLLASLDDPGLVLINPDEGEVTDLTQQVEGLRGAPLAVSWAPDGSQALMAQPFDGQHPGVVWLLSTSDLTARKLSDSERVMAVQWLEGGKGLLQTAAGCCGPMNLMISLPDGTRLSELDFQGGGSLAPDGRRFYLQPYQGAQLTIKDLAANTSQTMWDERPPGDIAPDGRWAYGMGPGFWSLDSRYLAYVVQRRPQQGGPPEPLPSTLRLVDLETGDDRVLAEEWVHTAAWLPNGGGLFYAHMDQDQMTVSLYQPGHSPRLLARHPEGFNWGLTQSPSGVISANGRRLAYAVVTGPAKSELFVVDLGTGKVAAVLEGANVAPLLWTADGTGLLVGQMEATDQSADPALVEVRLITIPQ